MHYDTYPVHPDLREFVKCIWTLHGSESVREKQVIVPDGSMEMIFHYGDLYRQYIKKDQSIVQPKCFVMGQLTEPLTIEPTGITEIFAVRFQPHGFIPFTHLPLSEFENTAVALDKVFGPDGIKLEEQLWLIDATQDRIKVVEDFLLNQIQEGAVIDRLIKTTIDLIWEANGNFSIQNLSEHSSVNRRKLERKFSSTVGISPKYLSRIIRMQSVLKELIANNYENLTSLAHKEGYYDQAHFIKDFKMFTGQTP